VRKPRLPKFRRVRESPDLLGRCKSAMSAAFRLREDEYSPTSPTSVAVCGHSAGEGPAASRAVAGLEDGLDAAFTEPLFDVHQIRWSLLERAFATTPTRAIGAMCYCGLWQKAQIA